MSSKTLMYLAIFIGSTVGGYLPVLWGASLFSVSSVVLSAVGSLIGLVIAYKLSE